jgi:ribosomal protein S17E
MGKIKSKQVKRAVHELLDVGVELGTDFEMNKKVLGSEMPSKKMRNKMAGYALRFSKQKEAELAALKK